MRRAHEFHRYFHPASGTRDRHQPADTGAGFTVGRQPAGEPVSAHRKRRRHHQYRLLRRGRSDRRRLHHAAARGGDRPGAGHRLPVLGQYDRNIDDHGDLAAELRLESRSDRDQHASQFGQEPVAAPGAAAGIERASRPDGRRDVHGLLQRHHPEQQRHRLSESRGQTEARLAGRGANRRDSGRTSVRAAGMAGCREARGTQRHGTGRVHGAGQQQLPGGGGQQQGSDGHRRHDRRHRSAFRSGVSPIGRSSRSATRSCVSRTSRR